MAVAFDKLTRPATNNPGIDTGHRKLGIGFGVIGLFIAMAVVIIGIVAAVRVSDGDLEGAEQLLAFNFGLNTVALVSLKTGIAVILIGILVRLWLRVEGIKMALPVLKGNGQPTAAEPGRISTPFGRARVTKTPPAPLPIHKMAKTMWAPMLLMGIMAVIAGFIVSIVWAGNVGTSTGVTAAAWTQGLQFLGEGLVLSGIALLLASILAGLRAGGASVQQELGLPVTTLEMPRTAQAFVVLMVAGLMVSIVQFGLYIWTTTFDTASEVAVVWTWLGPLREIGLGLLLASIVLALATIATALGFQFSRIRGVITAGR